jgi:hypothetical protein
MSGIRYEVCTPGITHQAIDGEVVIVDLRSGYYYSLLGAGAEVWALLDGGATAVEIEQALRERYTDEQDLMRRDLAGLVAELEQDGLIRPSGRDSRTPVALPPVASGAPLGPLALSRFTDMRDLILLDPIHEVDEGGWPNPREAA